MLVKSKTDGTSWLWVNVPKTASTSVMRTFFPHMQVNQQQHHSYQELISMYGDLRAFTTVRHPVHRFRSGLNHLFSVCECKKCTFNLMELPNTIEVIEFVKDLLILKSQIPNFFKVVYTNGLNDYYKHVVDSIHARFGKYINFGEPWCVRWPFIVSQTALLDGPVEPLKIFKYENINELFSFIHNELGYTVDNTIYRKYPNNLGVDFNDTTLLYLLRELYREDFINFNY